MHLHPVYLGVAEFWAGLFIQLQKPVPIEKDQLIGKAARLCLLAYETQRQREEGGKGLDNLYSGWRREGWGMWRYNILGEIMIPHPHPHPRHRK